MKNVQLVYPNGKFKAVTFSYDDGAKADERLVALFNRHKLKATFNLCSAWLNQEGYCATQEVAKLYDGHEVACHSSTHPTMTRLANETFVEEIMENRQKLEQLVGYPVKGFAYPNGAYDSRLINMLPTLGIDYARVVSTTGAFYLPDNWFAWQPTAHHNDELLEKGKQFVALQKSKYLFLMSIWGHSYEFDRDNTWDKFEEYCKLISDNADTWYATNGEVYAYINRFTGLKFSAQSHIVYNPFIQSVWLLVDGEVVEVKGGSVTYL